MTQQEIKDNVVTPITGLLVNLTTTDKTNLVAAIDEVLSKVSANYVTINQRINSAASNFNQTII